MNFILSNRGGGKTYHFTCWGIEDFKKTKQQTVWVRRYQTELDGEQGILNNDRFFDAVRDKYPNDELKIEGNTGLVNGEVAFIFIALSTSRQAKSNNFPYVNKIIFDEFAIDNRGRVGYLKNEVEIFLDLYETIARMRDNVRACLLANAISIVNPYFTFFGVKPNPEQRFTTKGQICIEMFTDSDFIEAKKKTRFGQLINGTRYGNYAINNKWLMDNNTFIESKTAKSEFMMSIKYEGITYGIWVDYKVGKIFVNRQNDPSSYFQYCLTKEDHEPNLLLIKSMNESKRTQRLVYAFREGLIRFEDMQIKNQFYEFIGYFVR